ncbi:putative lipid-transfer protein DIR1 [Aristolochia californica]|uniref:putative lipid-transfer protein DIR1 n=1 Tax=Aristolochia californica TaxID=171875 RepID=UPI0035D7E2C3
MAMAMSSIASVTVVVILLVLTASQGGEAMTLCNMDAAQLAECLPAIRAPSPSPPSKGCCDVMGTADLHCLCGYKDSYLLPSFGVDPKLAMALPRKCLLTPPPECEG